VASRFVPKLAKSEQPDCRVLKAASIISGQRIPLSIQSNARFDALRPAKFLRHGIRPAKNNFHRKIKRLGA
jgi:hypothetical protein